MTVIICTAFIVLSLATPYRTANSLKIHLALRNKDLRYKYVQEIEFQGS